MPDDTPVTWGRYTAATAALERRLSVLEAAADRRRDHGWALLLAALTGLALPVLLLLAGIVINRAIH